MSKLGIGTYLNAMTMFNDETLNKIFCFLPSSSHVAF